LFLNRKQAGYLLAEELEKQGLEFDIVLGIPRGGVVPAGIIARYFNKELDIILSRRIGSLGLDEPMVGAVAPDGEIVIPEQVQGAFPIDTEAYHHSAQEIRKELNRQTRLYRGNRPPLNIQGRRVLLVDDGIATGSTIAASVDYLKRCGAASIIIATPVCARAAYEELLTQVDHMIVLEIPAKFFAVSQFYQDFSAVEDEDIISIMRNSQPAR